MSVIDTKDNCSQTEKDKMFLSWKTYEGLQVTVHVLEEYFGKHRSIERRNDNPHLYNFGYNSNAIRMQRLIAPVTGNTRGSHKYKCRFSWV